MANKKSGNAVVEYFEALERLESGNARILAKNTPICNDAVSLEAGRKKGSIKNQRAAHQPLIIAISEAAKRQGQKKVVAKKPGEVGQKVRELTVERDGARGREISLLYEVYQLKKLVADLTGANVFPIRGEIRAET